MKITITQKTEKEIEVKLPIYLTSMYGGSCAIYAEDKIYLVDRNSFRKGCQKIENYFSDYPTKSTREEFMAQIEIAKKEMQQTLIDIVWLESMEQNPAMADMTVKDCSPERLEEMNYDVRDADEAERMERNSEIEN
jgi:hypothetical protein